jgi:hypothetical protein
MNSRTTALVAIPVLLAAVLAGSTASAAPSAGGTTTLTTYPLPAWWSTVTAVSVYLDAGGSLSACRAGVEMLPQGVAIAAQPEVNYAPQLIPWAHVVQVVQLDPAGTGLVCP